MLLIDMDTKLVILTKNLKRRKRLFVNEMRDYYAQVAA